MCEVKKCCCCLDLITGASGKGIFQLIVGLVFFGIGLSENGGAICTCLYNGRCFGEWQTILNLVYPIYLIGAGSCLLFGTPEWTVWRTLVFLVLQMIAIVLIAVAMLVLAHTMLGPMMYWCEGNMGVLYVAAMIFYAIFELFYIYFWVYVFRLYKRLRSGEIASPA